MKREKQLEEKLMKVYCKYGLVHQLEKLQEELRELDEVTEQLLTSSYDCLDHFAEEIGDVENVIAQLKNALKLNEAVFESRIAKVDRQLDRIAKGVEK